MKKYSYQHHVEIHGQPDKEWIILIHGAGGSTRSWYKQLSAFAEHFRVLAYDLRGHGRTVTLNEQDEHEYSFSLIAEDLLAIMDKHHIQSAHFCGCSLGTAVMQEMALKAPERISSMVMAGAVTKFTGWSKILYLVTRHFLIHVVSKELLYPLMAYVFMPFKLARSARRIFIRESRKMPAPTFYKWWKLTSQFDMYKQFDRCDIPTLIVMGEHDYAFMSSSYLLMDKFTNANHHILKKAGHVCNIDQPHSFNQLAISFLLEKSYANKQKTVAT